MKRILAILMALLLSATALTGCTREETLAVYNKLVEIMGGLALSNDATLAGERVRGADGYTGTYRAEYADFSGAEMLFGGTSTEARKLAVRCTLTVESGEAKLFCLSGSEAPKLLLASGGSYAGELTLPAGSCCIGVYGRDLAGKLDLTVE